MRLPRGFRTATFRLALLYAVLFGVSALVVFGIIYWTMTTYAARQMRGEIEAEISALVAEAKTEGIDHLIRMIERRILTSPHSSNYYLVQDTSGQELAGNLPPSPQAVGWLTLPSPAINDDRDPDEAGILAFGVTLPRNAYLLVGRDAHPLQELDELIIRAFAWAGAVTGGLALGGGLLMSIGFLRRVEAINRTSREIVSGNLTERVPTRATGDEFDRLAEDLNQMFDRIQALMDSLRQVSSDIAHDLRTPLSRLRQRLEGARLKAHSVAEYETAVERAIAETDAILGTFGSLLRIAQIGSGCRRAGFTTVDLSVVFETIVEAYVAVAEDGGRELSSSIAPRVTVRGDWELLTQMLANLVDNTLRHTHVGARIELRLECSGGEVVGTVDDNGPGIPEDARARVFERFFRLAASRATPGSGLGLSLVAAVAELHGIAITLADNHPGLRVTLAFPPFNLA